MAYHPCKAELAFTLKSQTLNPVLYFLLTESSVAIRDDSEAHQVVPSIASKAAEWSRFCSWPSPLPGTLSWDFIFTHFIEKHTGADWTIYIRVSRESVRRRLCGNRLAASYWTVSGTSTHASWSCLRRLLSTQWCKVPCSAHVQRYSPDMLAGGSPARN